MTNLHKQTTIHDIAKELNISVSTVSRALNNHPKISEETKRQVRKTANKLNYQVNAIASGLRKGRSNNIGVVVPRINRDFFSNVIANIESKASELGYNVIIMQSHEKYKNEVDAIEALLKVPVDGIAISLSIETENVDHLQNVIKRNVPLVLFDRTDSRINCSKIEADCYGGAFNATEHLIQQGCRNIVHMEGSSIIETYRDRKQGYLDAMKKYGIRVSDDMIIPNCLTEEDGYRIAKDLFDRQNKPDALISCSDYSALGCILYLKENGYKIPQDVAIVGFANEAFSSIIDPSLSSVDQFSTRIGLETATMLFNNIENINDLLPREIIIPTELIIRTSSQEK